MRRRTVALLVFDDFQLLDLAGPVEVLRTATHVGAAPPYDCVIVTPDGGPARSESGVQVTPDVSLGELRQQSEAGQPLHTLVVVGGLGARTLAGQQPVLDDLTVLSRGASRTTAVCTGALLLAAAGLLDGHQATTHWAFCQHLAERHPAVDVLPDRIYVQDRDRWTSAGVTAGIDLFLALVEADHGRELAHTVAGWLVVFVRRPGGQAQFSVQLTTQPARSRQIDELQRWLPDHLAEDLSVDRLARRAGMSARSFARAFRAESGTTPAAYVEQLRIEAARRLLETSDLNVAAVAAAVGFRRPETLHRAFTRRVGTTPDRYRQHFGTPNQTPGQPRTATGATASAQIAASARKRTHRGAAAADRRRASATAGGPQTAHRTTPTTPATADAPATPQGASRHPRPTHDASQRMGA